MSSLRLGRAALPAACPGRAVLLPAQSSSRRIASSSSNASCSSPQKSLRFFHLRSRADYSCTRGIPAATNPPLLFLHRPVTHSSIYTKSVPSITVSRALKNPRTPQKRSVVKQQTRNCSYRRNMCRHQALEGASTSVDVAGAREILPDNVKAVHYHLTLEPNLKTFEYDGEVVIDLDVVKDTTEIILNSIDLQIHSTKITEGSHVISSSPTVTSDTDKQTTTIKLASTIPAGSKVTLTHRFTSILNDQMAGFYRSSYKTKDGAEKYMATTQMEPTDARRAFPCFDEPSLKSKFTITLIADKDMTCLSNMDVASETEVDGKYGKGKKAVTFKETPLISTYLLAFIVGELDYIETKTFRIPVRVYAPPDQDIEHGRFSLELAAKTLEFYEKTFASPFPLPKMDMVAIPDFSAGAMENWGLVTYRIVDLLLDEKTSGASKKQRVAEVVQHELAHQWFGNLVTMDFWDGLWLNEGFATWMSWYSCNEFYPDWKVWENYVVDVLQSALSLDSLRSSHPIEVPVKRASEINQIFDAISYSKGSCVLRMISKYLGEDVFMEGIRKYLKKHAYGNTQTTDLWAALSDASGKPVERVMDIWTKRVGYPVVTVTEKPESGEILVKQNRFLRTNDAKPEEDETLYPVFLGLRTKSGVNEDITLEKREGTFKLGSDLDFYKINADHCGLYRTSYSYERMSKLGDAAKKGLLTVEDRAGLISDAGALAASGHQPTTGVLNLLQGFGSETEYIVWDEMLTRVDSIRLAWSFEDEKVRDALKQYQLELLQKKAHELGWEFSEKDGHVEQQFKALMFNSAGLLGDEIVLKAARDMLTKYVAGDKSAIHPNIRSAVFGINVRHGGEKEYDEVLGEFRKAATSDQRNDALRALGRAPPALVQRSLDLALSDEVKTQDIYLPLASLRTSAAGIDGLWNWMTKNWSTLEKRLPPGLSMLSTVVMMCTSGFTHKDQADTIRKFFEGKDTKGFEMSLAQSLDGVQAKSQWVERDAKNVEEWLKKGGYLA